MVLQNEDLADILEQSEISYKAFEMRFKHEYHFVHPKSEYKKRFDDVIAYKNSLVGENIFDSAKFFFLDGSKKTVHIEHETYHCCNTDAIGIEIVLK